jgi:hypothetical protein
MCMVAWSHQVVSKVEVVTQDRQIETFDINEELNICVQVAGFGNSARTW